MRPADVGRPRWDRYPPAELRGEAAERVGVDAADRRGQAVAEALVELVEVLEGAPPLTAVDGEHLAQARGGDVEAVEVDRAGRGHVPDGRLDRLGAAVDASE